MSFPPESPDESFELLGSSLGKDSRENFSSSFWNSSVLRSHHLTDIYFDLSKSKDLGLVNFILVKSE